MKKIAIIYYSDSGNTEQMAESVLEGAKASGADASLFNVSEITPEVALSYDALALGCSAKGVEQLEESTFEPFFAELETKLSGKTIGLFGSYGWGGGEWMRTWEERVKNSGANLVRDGVISLEAPDETVLDECKSIGTLISK